MLLFEFLPVLPATLLKNDRARLGVALFAHDDSGQWELVGPLRDDTIEF